MAALGILLEARQHGGPVEVGHHDVEQDQIDPLALKKGHRFPAARRGQHLVTIADEPPGQELPVLLVVVDDQDRGPGVPCARGRAALGLVRGRSDVGPGQGGSAAGARLRGPCPDQVAEPRDRAGDAARTGAVVAVSRKVLMRSASHLSLVVFATTEKVLRCRICAGEARQNGRGAACPLLSTSRNA